MAGTRVETTIAYKLDAKGLKDARKELEKSFRPDSVKALNAALKDARTRVKDITAEYGKAAKAQGLMANAPKAMRANLKAARDEVQRLTADLEKQVGTEQKLLAVKQRQLQLAREQRGSAFRQGLYQGIGGPVGSYMQRRENATTAEQRAEMAAQFRGQMVGGAGRAAWGAARGAVGMASGMAGGAGPMGTLLGNVPFLGGAAQLAEGAVGSFVERQRANLAALPFMGRAGMVGGRAGRAAVPERFTHGAANDTLQGRFDAAGQRVLDIQARSGGYGPEPGRLQRAYDAFSGEPHPSLIAGAGIQGIMKARQATAVGGSYTPGSPAVAAIAAHRETAADRIGGFSRGLMTGTEEIQYGSRMAGAVGGGLNRAQTTQAFAAQTMYGVDQSTSAQLFRQQRAGRGGSSSDQTNMLAKAIGAATAQGLEGSEIGEYLDTIASAQATAESKGLKLDTDSVTGLGVGLSKGLGLEGPQAGRIAGNLQGIAQGVVTNGAKGPIDIQALRAAGFDPEKGNFLETRRKLAGGMDASTSFDFLQNLVGGEGNALKRGYTLEKAGLGLGTEQAIKVQEMLGKGKGAFMAAIGNRTGSAADLAGMLGSAAVKDVSGGIRGANAVANTLVGAGGAAAGNVQTLQQEAAKTAATMATALKPIMDPITKSVATLSDGLRALIRHTGEWASNDGIPVKIMK